MGKRKKSVPQRVTEEKRKCMTWNMLEPEPQANVINLVSDNEDEACNDKILTNSDSADITVQNCETQNLSPKDDLKDIFDLHVENSLFHLTVLSQQNIKDNAWWCELAYFQIQFSPSPLFVPLPKEGLPQPGSFTLYVSREGEKSILYFEYEQVVKSAFSNNKKSKQKLNVQKDFKFWLVDVDLPFKCCQALKCKSLQVVVDRFDTSDMSLTLKVIGLEHILTLLGCPSEAVRLKGQNQSLLLLMEHFYGIVAPNYEGRTLSLKHDIDDLYAVVKERHACENRVTLPGIQHPDLLPWLRPYQQEAIAWMLEREKQAVGESDNGDLHMLYTEVTTKDKKVLYFNRYAGIFVLDPPLVVAPPPGGILGDEMGLGKTVEVLGCMLHHPRESVPLPDILPVIEDEPVPGPGPSKPRRKGKKKREKKVKKRRDSHSPDSDTILYTDDVESDMKQKADEHAKFEKNSGCSQSAKREENDHCSQLDTLKSDKDESVHLDVNSHVDGERQEKGTEVDCNSDTKFIPESIPDNITGVPNGNDSPVTPEIDNIGAKAEKRTDNVQVCGVDSSPISDIDSVLVDCKSEKTIGDKPVFGSSDLTGSKEKTNNGAHFVYKNIFTERPAYHREEFECVCGSNEVERIVKRKNNMKHPVKCVKCNLWQHAECVNYDLKDPYRGEFKCPHCHVSSPAIPSGATLIISPFSIANQWVEEILKHIVNDSINVFMYTGVNKQGFIQPRTLARQDIVITTYETLRKEIDYVDLPHSNSEKGRKLRHPKRFMAIPSPITAVEWWRICLDEAQMVECTTTKTAEMALRLSAVNKWCVTGTPIQRGVEDLYGLLLFLGVDPYWVQQWWNKLVYGPFCHGITEPMYELLTSVLWRTVKNDVLDQIDIPDQTELVHWLTFSPVEEHFYRRQYRDCVRLSMERLGKWTDSSMKLSSLDRHTVNQLLYPLLRLRQACCHPQAVRGEFIPIHKSTMTMEELLESLTKKAKLEAEESHRALVASMNGQAGLHIIQEEFVEAVERYREVLRSVEEHKDELHTDSLQQLHAMYNLQEILTSKPEGVDPTLRDHQLQTQIVELKDKYMAKAIAYVKGTEEALAPVQVDVKQLQRELNDGREWWLEVIQWSIKREQDDILVLKVRDDLLDNRNPQINTLVRSCRSSTGLKYAIEVQLSGLHTSYTEVIKTMEQLNGKPSLDLINKTVECCLRPISEILKTCPFCKSEELFEAYESKLFSFVEKGVEGSTDNLGYQVNIRRQGTWADSEVEKALKSILSFAKSYKGDSELIEYGTVHIKLLDALKKEYKRMRTHWAGIKEHVATFDELDMSTTRLRLRLPEEPAPETPQLNILERAEVSHHKLKLVSDRILANGELRKKLGQLLYLKNLAKNQSDNKGGDNPEPCPICQQELGKEWSVMQCGHCYCIDCVRILVERAGHGRRHFSVKCAVCRQGTNNEEISYVTTKPDHYNGEDDNLRVKGSHSTKVEAVVQCLLKIKRDNPKAKSLVFSTWTDVLSVIATALDDNGIEYKALYTAGKFQQNLSAFKQHDDVTTLLLPVHSGANGLNLIEATNVLLVEPILNPAQELQAIGRVHRIGQQKATQVHRFLIRGTIEQKMQVLIKSMDKHCTAKSSEDSALTIGDLSSLFAQQMEGENREGDLSVDEGEGEVTSNEEGEGTNIEVEEGTSFRSGNSVPTASGSGLLGTIESVNSLRNDNLVGRDLVIASGSINGHESSGSTGSPTVRNIGSVSSDSGHKSIV